MCSTRSRDAHRNFPPYWPAPKTLTVQQRCAYRAVVDTGDHPWTVAVNAAQADFRWDADTGSLLRRSGDTVAHGVFGMGQLHGTIEKWNATEALRPCMNDTRARLVIGSQANGARHAPDAIVDVSLHHAQGALAAGYLTIFDLGWLGMVQALYPVDKADGDGRPGPGGTLPVTNARIVSPYGTDHVIALITAAPPVQFRALLHTLDNQPAAAQFAAQIRKLLTRQSAQASLSLAELCFEKKGLGGSNTGSGETGGA